MPKHAFSLLALAAGGALAVNIPPETPLNRVPFIMSHDTATGYLGELYELYENQIDPELILIGWTKTQTGTVTDQIECGARAFDMRPYLSEKEGLIAHHGGILVLHQFKDMMKEMVDWANENPEEFLVPEIAHCSGDNDELKEQCNKAARDVLDELEIPYIFEDECPEAIQGMTLGEAMDRGQLPGGGHILAIYGACWKSNYDSSRNCRGYEYESAGVSRRYDCWINGTNPNYAVNRLFEYLDETHAAGPPPDGELWQMQALWQSVQQSISLGTTYGSSLLIDEKYSRLNRFMFENLTDGRWGEPGVDGPNMFEVDFVCDQGQNVLMALDPAFTGNWTQFPDTFIVNDTGVASSILDGENVIFYVAPDNYTPMVFNDTETIRRRHRNARWGNTNDIVEFFNGDEDKQNEYLKGILGTSILIWCVFFVWAIILLWAKWSNKLKWISGAPPSPPEPATKTLGNEDDSVGPGEEAAPEDESTDDAAVEDPAARKYRLRVRRIRITVLCCGLIIVVLSGLLIGLGFKGLYDALDSMGDSMDAIQEIIKQANLVTNDYLVQANQTSEARANFINALVNNCELSGQVISNVTGLNVSEAAKGNLTDDLIDFNQTLNNFTGLYEKMDSINSSLYSLNQDIESAESTVDDAAANILFPIAIAFICLVDVVVIYFMVGVILSWRKQQPRLFRDCTTRAAVPFFLLLLLIMYVVSTLALIAATLAADFCIKTPDDQILRIINASAPFDEELEYIIRGCNPDLKPQMLPDLFKALEGVLITVHEVLTELKSVPPEEVPCANPELVISTVDALQVEYEQYVELLYRIGVALGCDKLNTIWTLLAYNASCTNGFDSMSEIFAYLFVIAVASMAIITLRVAWYETDDAADIADQEAREEGFQDEYEPAVSEDDDYPEASCDPAMSGDTGDEASDKHENALPDEDKNITPGFSY